MPDERIATVDVTRVSGQSASRDTDVLAVEEPLEIRVAWVVDGEPREKNIAVTMRTPGDDADLASGFLFTEALIASHQDIESIRHWSSPNVIRVALRPGVRLDSSKLDRHFYTTSSCGVCGKTSIDALRVITSSLPPNKSAVDREIVHRLPAVLSEQQAAFRATGGIHGAAPGGRAKLSSRGGSLWISATAGMERAWAEHEQRMHTTAMIYLYLAYDGRTDILTIKAYGEGVEANETAPLSDWTRTRLESVLLLAIGA